MYSSGNSNGRGRQQTPAHSTGHTADAVDPAAAYAELQDLLDRVYENRRTGPDPDGELVAGLSEAVKKLVRAGPEHALAASFASLIETTTLIVVRYQANIRWELAAHEPPCSSEKGRNSFDLPPGVQDMLPAIDAVGNLTMKLADTYARFLHVMNMTKEKDAGKPRKQQPPRKPVEASPPENGSHSRAAQPPRLRVTKGHPQRPKARGDQIPGLK